jgi:CheY-like chemotaxis protein
LKNAVKFTPESGQIQLRSREEDGRLVVQVADNGVGIAPESLDRIFLAFEQAQLVKQNRCFDGLGLGLWISKAILQLHGGEIRAESAGRNQGATFEAQLPLTDAPVAKPVESPAPARVVAKAEGDTLAASPLRVLLVEDHEATIQVLRRLLTRAGHHVTTAMTVGGAKQAADHKQFDVVISDLGLPDGTGFELMEDLRNSHHLRGIALSGYGMDDDVRRSRAAGFTAHLIKPVDFTRLQHAVTELVES